MSGYIETLYILNQKLIKMCGLDIMLSNNNIQKEILDIIQDIPRLIPYKYNQNNKHLTLEYKSGILEFKDQIAYLENDYKNILITNYDFLDRIRKIRNNYAHKMHDVKYRSSTSGTLSLFSFTFEIKQKELTIKAGEFIKLLEQTNILFSKIVNDISEFSYQNNLNTYAYYSKIIRFDFKDFNKLYKCDILRETGKIMYRF